MGGYVHLLSSLLLLLTYTDADCGCGDVSRRDSTRSMWSAKGLSVNHQAQCAVCEVSWDADEWAMVPEGEYQLGTDEVIIQTDAEGPSRLVRLPSFYLHKYEVSNAHFAEFVAASSYRTEANLFGDSFVFAQQLNNSAKSELKHLRAAAALWWYKVPGADWSHPAGPGSSLEGLWDHPVTHVSWHDAAAYCAWRGGRLPTEAEWEAACRAGSRNTRYPWGDMLFPNRTHMANIWQGTFPTHNSAKDGYTATSPVTTFPQNSLQLHNIVGNVWEWTADPWSQVNQEEKVKKGGSFLCHKSYCFRYRCASRAHNTGDSSAANLGFRCARSPSP